ncbi:MAG: hypothetical protein KAH13_02220 [Tenericutes bacterium]|nr:hypothetical protein [Mycoplasmatota bacterium]
MLNYIKKTEDNKLYISSGNNIYVFDIPIKKYFNKMLKKQFNRINTLEITIKRNLSFKAKIPLYIDAKTLLMCIRSYRLDKSLYLNYFSIAKYEFSKHFVIITFLDFHVMKLYEKNSFIKQLEKSRLVLDYLR